MTTIDSDADEAAVRLLMAESDLDVDGEDALLAALLDLRDLRNGVVDEPSAEVAALMIGRPRRRLRTRGAIIVSLVVAASVGTGLSAAAAPHLGESAQQAIAAVVHAVNRFAAAPTHHAPASAAPAVVPARATGTGTAVHPHRPASVPAKARTTGSGATLADASGEGRSAQHGVSRKGDQPGSGGHGEGSGGSSEHGTAPKASSTSNDGGGEGASSASGQGSDGSGSSTDGGSSDAIRTIDSSGSSDSSDSGGSSPSGD